MPTLSTQVQRRRAEDDAEQRADEHGRPGELRRRLAIGDVRLGARAGFRGRRPCGDPSAQSSAGDGTSFATVRPESKRRGSVSRFCGATVPAARMRMQAGRLHHKSARQLDLEFLLIGFHFHLERRLDDTAVLLRNRSILEPFQVFRQAVFCVSLANETPAACNSSPIRGAAQRPRRAACRTCTPR